MANSPNGGTNYRLAHSNKRPKINPPGVTAILNNKSRDAFLPRKFCLSYYIFTEGLSKKKSWLKNSQNLENFIVENFRESLDIQTTAFTNVLQILFHPDIIRLYFFVCEGLTLYTYEQQERI